jgi:hypothetical protein
MTFSAHRTLHRSGGTAAPFLLFVPSYGRGGTGEFVRAGVMAQAAARRWTGARIEFLLPSGPGTRTDTPFPKQVHDGPEHRKPHFDREWIRRLRPDVAIFDSGCRTATLRACNRLGVRTVYVSDRHGTCRKAFRMEWLRRLDQHWLMREHVTAEALSASQALKHRYLGRTRLVRFDTYYPEHAANPANLASALGDIGNEFVLLSAGGGGYRIGDVQASDLYVDAARRIAAASGMPCLVLLGALHEGEPALTRGVRSIRSTSLEVFIELLRRARVAVINGGHTTHQALAQQAVCVATCVGGADQPARIAKYADAGLLRSVPPEPAAIAGAVVELLAQPQLREAIQSRIQALRIVNGVPMVLDALAELLSAPHRSPHP